MEQPQKNCIYTIEITGVTSEGNGVGRINGFVVFVPNTVTGDTAEILIVKVRKNYAYGKALSIKKISDKRQEPVCKAFGKCGGCSLMHIKYEYQTEIKKAIIDDAFKRICETNHVTDEFIGAENITRYRNKMIFPVGKDKNAQTVCGFYRERSHDIIPLEDCLLGESENADILFALKEYMRECFVEAYDEKEHRGIIRRIFIRNSETETMVVISANADILPKKEILTKKLLCASDKIASIILNVNKKRTNLVLGDENKILYGNGTIKDHLCGAEYEISPHSFYQVNHEQTERLYGKALEYAQIEKNDVLMDIYCGIGTISLSAARMAGKVVGVEIVPQAIEDARENAKRNGIENAEFYCADAADLVPQIIKNGVKPDVVILDPPRKGSDEKTLNAITSVMPERIVYVSCNPATLARDVKFIVQKGYEINKICGVDMFPNTSHVETVVQLIRKKPDTYIDITVDMDELDLTASVTEQLKL